MAQQTGELVGREALAKGFNVQLAGGANLVREPRGGRNFEYLSEDPQLTGIMASHLVRGIQSQHVVSTVKHFAVNPQETGRVVVSSDLSEAAMRESDLLAFELAIEVGSPGAVMPGYNLVNGDWASENAYLLNDVLKGDWQYPGWVMSDWGATHSAEKAALAGLDVQSGANLDEEVWFGEPLKRAVAEGRVPQSRIDDMVRRILRSLFAVGAVEHVARRHGDIDYMAHRLIAQREAEQGIVLLKNAEDVLPLARGASRLLVVGAHADHGVLAGGGSSCVTPVGSLRLPGVNFMGIQTDKVYQPSSPLHAIRAESGAAEVEYLSGNNLAEAVSAARQADAVIVFADEWRSEALDAQGLGLSDAQNTLIKTLAATHAKTIVVLETGGPVTMSWLDAVPAVLEAWYPIDILILNAAQWLSGGLDDQPDTEIINTISSGLTGSILLTQALLPGLRRSENADIVSIISSCGVPNFTDSIAHPAFFASKHGLSGFTTKLAQQLFEENIRVTGLYPPDFEFIGLDTYVDSQSRMGERLINGRLVWETIRFVLTQPRN